GDSVAVRGSRKQRAEDEEVERALQQFYTGWRLAMHCVGILLQLCRVSTNNGNREVKQRMPANNASVLTEDVQRPVCRQSGNYAAALRDSSKESLQRAAEKSCRRPLFGSPVDHW